MYGFSNWLISNPYSANGKVVRNRFGRPKTIDLFRFHACLGPLNVVESPLGNGFQNRSQRLPFRRQPIGLPTNLFIRNPFLGDAVLDELAQPIGENVCSDLLWRLAEVLVIAPSKQHVADDQERPFVANQIKRAGDWAGRTLVFRFGFRHFFHFQLVNQGVLSNALDINTTTCTLQAPRLRFASASSFRS